MMDQLEQMEMHRKLSAERQLLDVLCRDYTAVYFANLKEDMAEPLKIALNANATQIARIQVRKQIGYTQNVKNYCECYVKESQKKEFLRVMDNEHLLQELEKTERFVYRYESIPNKAGHRYFEVQVMRVSEPDFDGNVMVAFHHIDDIITKEQKYELELEKTAYSDALTQLGNRALFTRDLISLEQDQSASCVVADVNNLKPCNDRYGHKAGDAMLADAADCIQKAFERIGTCYRIGGDEFCVLIRDGNEKEILGTIERLQTLIADKNLHRNMPLSLACGYAVRENFNESMEQVFNRSDEMMYDVKYRMKKEFPVYSEERIKNYLNVLRILCKTTDSYLYLKDINRDENWFFGDVNRDYDLLDEGQEMISTERMKEIVYPADRARLQEDLQEISEGKKQTHDMNYRWVNRRGEIVWINCRGTVIDDDKGKPFVMIGRVSDKALQYLYHPMTKLFNKNKLFLDLENEFLIRDKGYFMLLGIDDLGSINLRHGRNYGDDVIMQCAEILERKVSLQNVWHVESNCFALYLDVETEEEVHDIYDELLREMSKVCSISAGVVPNNRNMFGDAHSLYACGKTTFEKAKSSGGRTILFCSQEDMEERIKIGQFLEEMQKSTQNGFEGFYLCYQPQIKAGNYHLFGAEALLRFRSQLHGEVYPDQFVPLLEQSKLINQVGMWILETALLQCKKWRETVENFHISVNFSVVQLKEKNVAEKVLKVLEKTGLPGSVLTIEITESRQLHESQHFRRIFKIWRDAGIELSIDDFGTGYASMSYLKELHINEIKIDRLFVRGIEEATYNYRLISNMIEFAKSNAIRICCEGVETTQELVVLENLSPNLIQGYLFSKPCKTDLFERTFIDNTAEEYKKKKDFVQKIYQYKEKAYVIYFNVKDILRENDLGLWLIRFNEEERNYELHPDETMERIMGLDRKYMPQECYEFWHSRIKEEYRDYVWQNVKRMMTANKVVQLQYPWMHPQLGEVMVQCSGKRVEDSDGMVTLEGYHRIISNIEENFM